MRRLLVSAACLAALLPITLTATPADAGPAGRWTSVSGAAADLGIIMRPSAYRTADDVLHVVYVRKDGASSYSLWHSAVGDDGRVLRNNVVLSDWDTIAKDPRIVPTTTGLRIAFGGQRTTDRTDPYGGGQAFQIDSTDGGATWSLLPGTIGEASIGTGYGMGATDMPDGSTYVSGALNARVLYRNGSYDPEAPVASPSFDTATCCAYDTELARVPGTDQVWMSWMANGRTADSIGNFVRQISPTLGPILKAPQSSVNSDSGLANSPLSGSPPLVAKADGSVYLAYPVGYPTRRYVGIWKVGSSRVVRVPASEEARYADLSVDRAGRLWVAWVSRHTVRAARSNPGVTAFGPARGLGTLKVAGADSTWGVLIDGTGNRPNADVIATNGRQLLHQEVLAGLSLRATPTSWRGSGRQRVTFTVTDAGAALAGARVSAGGRNCTTSAAGTCSMRLSAPRPRVITATARKAGYTGDQVNLRVRR
ncbi:hypothetical protein [Nocardioides sp. R-C-SC26]|uniref:hypothetical protein n=1 Tax=Nocardioides sp. R-C-SC26 TaxID=2870414 RepID=UPI001E503248|nr:hypothetical protein [Nocardioides sp. R-C-SC26]